MSNYTESKKQLDTIKGKYGCKGDIIFKTAIQNIIDFGRHTILDVNWCHDELIDINEKHDIAEKEGKWMWVTRDFEIAILECMQELAEINPYNLLIYIQREVWLGGGPVGEPDYQRAMQIIRNCLCYTADCCAYSEEVYETLCKFREMELTDDEIAYFGWEYLFDVEEEEDE